MTLPAVSHEAIQALLRSRQLPRATSIEHRELSAQYHTIYMLTLQDGSQSVLRVAGNQLPHRKTANEVGVMAWVQKNTTIPVPNVLAYDTSASNPLGREYSLLERVPGVCADSLYGTLDTEGRLHLIRQIADFVIQLHKQPFSHVGGLLQAEDGTIKPGPVVEVRSWQTADAAKAWASGSAIDTFNVVGPFETWTQYSVAKLQKCLDALSRHPALAKLNKQLAARIYALIAALQEEKQSINDCAYVLAHKDLHFSNFMCDPDDLRITGVLDWEFSQVAPLPSWDPGNFLLLCPASDEDAGHARVEQQRAVGMFRSECKKRGAASLVSVKKTDQQEAMEDAVELLGWIVRSVPTGKYADMIETWLEELDEALEEFDI